MRMRDVAAVMVDGLVAHSIAHDGTHAATVRISTSMSEKYFRDRRSDSLPAAMLRPLNCSPGPCRARTAGALSPAVGANRLSPTDPPRPPEGIARWPANRRA